GFAGNAVLEDHHRSDDLGALDVGDVEALDAERQRLEIEHLAKLLERFDAPQPFGLGDERLARERELGVALRQLLQPAFLAALGCAEVDLRAPELGEEALQRREVAKPSGDEDLRWDRGRSAVVLEAEALKYLERFVAGGVLEMERVAVDHPAASKREDL